MARMQNGLIGSTIVSTPRWLADFGDPEIAIAHFPAKIDPTLFTDKDAMLFTVSGAVAQNGTTINLLAAVTLPPTVLSVPVGAWLNFGAGKTAQLTVPYTGGTTLSVSAIPTALVGGETAYYQPFAPRVQVLSGTLLGRTYVQRAANAAFGPATLTSDEVFLLLHDVIDATLNNNIELVRQGRAIKENYLPQYAAFSTATNEVQTYVNSGTLTAGNFLFRSFDTGTETEVAYNANLAALQTAFDTLFGATNTVVAGTMASFTVTGAGAYANKPMQLAVIDGSSVTGFTGGTSARTVVGGYGTGMLALLRSKYQTILGTN